MQLYYILAPCPSDWRPALNIHWDIPCKDSTELTFFIGGDNRRIQAAKQHYIAPASLAFRKSYDLASGRGKGFIWVALPDALDPARYPDLHQTTILEAILTHEIGHVARQRSRHGNNHGG